MENFNENDYVNDVMNEIYKRDYTINLELTFEFCLRHYKEY